MFETFKNNIQYRKQADQIGKEIHHQLQKALREKTTALGTYAELAFTAGYLTAFTQIAFSKIGCNDSAISRKYIKYFCDGVLPGRLWDFFQRGEALKELSLEGNREEFIKTRESYNLGILTGNSDSDNYFDKGIRPVGLYNFLIKN